MDLSTRKESWKTPALGNLGEKEGTRAFATLVYRVTWEARSEAGTSSRAPRREEPDVQPRLSGAGLKIPMSSVEETCASTRVSRT